MSESVQIALESKPNEARKILSCLGDWYTKHHRKLPFRTNVHWYRTLVSEVMLQQTRVQAMLPAYQTFMERFPDVHSLARASQSDVLEHWAGLGYYSRARNLHSCAREIVQNHGASFPADAKQALALPGIGPYTAAAVRSIALEIPDPVIDGNVIRVLSRIFLKHSQDHHCVSLDSREDSKSESFRIVEKDYVRAANSMASSLMECSPLRPSVHNQAIMELGALICTPGLPSCMQCPVKHSCSSFQAGGAALASTVPPLKKVPRQDLFLEVYWITINEQAMLIKNGSRPLFRNDWFLPCRIRSNDGLIYSDFIEQKLSSFLGGIGSKQKKANESANLELRKFKHSIMNYRIQGELLSIALSFKQAKLLLKEWSEKERLIQNENSSATRSRSVAEARPEYARQRGKAKKSSAALLQSNSVTTRNSKKKYEPVSQKDEIDTLNASQIKQYVMVEPREVPRFCPSSIIKKAIPGIFEDS